MNPGLKHKTSMAETNVPFVETQLRGYFRSDYVSAKKTVLDLTGSTRTEGLLPPMDTQILDARVLQVRECDGNPHFESRFLHSHGFVLLDHLSNVENWDSGALPQFDALEVGPRRVVKSEGENEIETKYVKEVEQLIRNRLLPGKKLEIEQPVQVLRRGKETANPFFGVGVHNDYGSTPDDFQDNIQAYGTEEKGQEWRNRFDSEDVEAFMVINFWRTVHMHEPLKHMPLAVLDARSIDAEDLVSSGLKGFTFSGKVTNQLSLRYNENLRWYYYPDMTVDEVLVLKLFHAIKGESTPKFRSCYHSAFENPHTPDNVKERQSCEHRVNVFVLKD